MYFDIFQEHRNTAVRVPHNLLTNNFQHVLDMRRWNNLECLTTNLKIALNAEETLDRIHFNKALKALPEAQSRLARCREDMGKSPVGSPAK